MHDFISELRRRNVLRVAAFYAAAGWLLVQVATQVFPFYDVPNGVVRVVISAIALGFPAVLVLAWFYELTPEGLKLERQAAAAPADSRRSARRLDRWISVVLGLAVAVLLADRFVLKRPQAGAPAADLKSIAVLPFENLSDDKSNAYFAEGIQDEILTRLAKIGALKVISRTSTQQYAAKPGKLSEIGAQLGVANILEGSVQKAGDTVHINVQLIRAATDEHLWAEVYDRKLDNIFGVEGEVAGAVATALDARLSGAEAQQLAARPTANPDAYDAYLRGVALMERGDDLAANAGKAVAAFAEAVRLDPRFVLAWAQLARAHSWMYSAIERTPAHKDAAHAALAQAQALGPELLETSIAQGFVSYWVERDNQAARAQFERVRDDSPNNADALSALGAIARTQGRWQDSRTAYRQALALDPRNTFLLLNAVATDWGLRDLNGAARLLQHALDVSPDDPGVLNWQSINLMLGGHLDEAKAVLERIHPVAGDQNLIGAIAWSAELRRDYPAAIAAAKAQLAAPALNDNNRGSIELLLGSLQRHAGLAEAQDSYWLARDLLRRAVREQPDNAILIAALSDAEAGLGDQAEALRLARQAVALEPASLDAVAAPRLEENLAELQARFGDKDAAFAAFELLVRTPYVVPMTPALLRLDPDLDALRSDPRFPKLLADAEAAMQP